MDFLFEIGLEELPSRYVDEAENNLKKLAENELKIERIKYSTVESFSTPRRVAIIIKDISEKQEDLNKKSIGPSVEIAYKDGVLTKAGEGFIKSQGATEKEVKIIENEKGKYISIEQFIPGKSTKEVLAEILANIIKKIEFEKSMKWGANTFRFARPIKWFVALLDGEILNFEFEGIKAGNKTRGMRYFASQEIEISKPNEYEKKLRENYVIPKKVDRKAEILRSVRENCEKDGEQAVVNDYLLEEVVNLVEYPYAIKGEFNKDYLFLPEQIITITMETHQRYFPVRDANKKLKNKFVVIRNAPEYSETVKKGNEKVIEPRLSDARFFYEEDLKIPLDSNVEKLKTVIFQKDLGTIYAKMKRSEKIANYLINKLGYTDKKEDILRTVKLAKADLVSNMIGEKEFTKLQGFMGADYALKLGEKDNVSLGIKEHYYPRFQGDLLPSGIEGIITGLSDRVDTLVGCFGVGLIPTGSKDPYALRRAALGIVNVIVASNLDISLKELVNVALDALEADGVLKLGREKTETDVLDFFKQRIINVLSDLKYSRDIILAVVDKNFDNITDVLEKVKAILEYSKKEDFSKLLQTIKRVGNISRDNNGNKIKEALFQNDYERVLWEKSKALSSSVEKLLSQRDYTEYLKAILNISEDIDKYFENTIVMDENKDIRANRVNQMTYLMNIFTQMAYLNKLD
ncbi:glycine--tRNA ligase subunit beta [Fusobacterium russii]|uniref:glycine--tRNA ligase subunit beta n=1 Tax=Fusobacterium russii TaxID=854 RepID=UPI00039E3BFD|nr:glycine--tRNA ligase subunit beta [Fusobacterium russii]